MENLYMVEILIQYMLEENKIKQKKKLDIKIWVKIQMKNIP